ncbi:MAG: 6-carboxytetrahydropterin synthase [Micrococcales bacterium]|nr:6-carboxytetrahydropterin synthase [Micrococcales bacterium]
MFRLTVRDHVMVAHSLPDPFFGPAAGLHGATFVVEATFERPDLDEHGVVVDIGEATTRLSEVLGRLNYRNLDELEEFRGVLTTTERLAQHIASGLDETMDLTGITAVEVLLRENPDAWASYRLKRDG